MVADCAHILVIDDDRRLRSLLQRYLQENGFAVSVAQDAESARLFLQQYLFDLLIVDVMTGIAIAASIESIAITITSSTSVKPLRLRFFACTILAFISMLIHRSFFNRNTFPIAGKKYPLFIYII